MKNNTKLLYLSPLLCFSALLLTACTSAAPVTGDGESSSGNTDVPSISSTVDSGSFLPAGSDPRPPVIKEGTTGSVASFEKDKAKLEETDAKIKKTGAFTRINSEGNGSRLEKKLKKAYDKHGAAHGAAKIADGSSSTVGSGPRPP